MLINTSTPKLQTETTDACVPGPDQVAALVAQVYEESPPTARARMLEYLLKPLSLLSLSAVANGVFARITLANGWSRLRVNVEDAAQVNTSEVLALVTRVQEVSAHALVGLTGVIAASPVLTGSAAAAMLLTLLRAQAYSNKSGSAYNDFDPIS